MVSTDLYHSSRPDVIVALLTSQITKTTGPTDLLLLDWAAAGLRQPSIFRVYLQMFLPKDVFVIGHLSARDWQEAKARLLLSVAVK